VPVSSVIDIFPSDVTASENMTSISMVSQIPYVQSSTSDVIDVRVGRVWSRPINDHPLTAVKVTRGK
jgi:hypothetical protein